MDDVVEGKKSEIEKIGLNAIKEYFEIDLAVLNPEVLKHLHNRARIGMQFEREMSVSKRAIEGNYLRVFKMVAEDKEELKQLIRKSLPQYLD